MITRIPQLHKDVKGIVLIAVTLATAIRLLAVSAPLGVAWSKPYVYRRGFICG